MCYVAPFYIVHATHVSGFIFCPIVNPCNLSIFRFGCIEVLLFFKAFNRGILPELILFPLTLLRLGYNYGETRLYKTKVKVKKRKNVLFIEYFYYIFTSVHYAICTFTYVIYAGKSICKCNTALQKLNLRIFLVWNYQTSILCFSFLSFVR